VSAIITEIGVETKKIRLEQGSRDLFVRDLNFQGIGLKKLGDKT
jgi:hypothetical protein